MRGGYAYRLRHLLKGRSMKKLEELVISHAPWSTEYDDTITEDPQG